MKTYQELKNLLNFSTQIQTTAIMEYFNEMSDDEFKNISVILCTPETKKVIETYGTVMGIMRKVKGTDEFKNHTIYFMAPSVFRIVT